MVRGDSRKSIDYFQQAIARDPAYGFAYAGLALSYGTLAHLGNVNPGDAMLKTKTAALRAIELDPNLTHAHLALAQAYFFHDYAAYLTALAKFG